jgi:parallel beta-helix repeat protein
MKKRIGIGVLVVGVLAFFFFTRTKMPKYSPERDYIDMEAQILEAFILAKDSSTIQLPEGHFLFSQSLSLDAKKHITIKGMGMDKTILSFKGQTQGAEGIKVTNSENVTIEDLAVEDAAGDNIKISDTDTLILRNIRSAWTGKVSTENGAYALYPVLSTQVLIEGCEAIGSSDAGIYVGQSQNVIIRNNKAYYNVAGIESENSSNVEIYGNEAFENTSGLLIFNLPELTVYGKQVKAYQNKIYNNNIPNFGVKGSIVSAVPKGTGVVIMATQDIAFYDNTVEDHKTSNLSIVSYKVFAADEDPQNNSLGDAAEARGLRAIQTDYESDLKYNAYPGNISISANRFNNQFSFPTLSNDFGKLWYFKNDARIPDIAYDGIFPEGVQLQDPSVKLCIDDNGAASFVFLDAANDFENFSNDLTPFNCLAD